VVGTIGSLFLLSSLILFATESEALWQVGLFVVVTFVSLGLLIKFALLRLQQGDPEESMYHSDDQEGYVASSYNKEFIGKDALALSQLGPSGYIDVEGQRIQAVSKSGFIQKGQEVTIIAGEGAHYIVIEKG
jgi:membrane-bound ClpP family serine protease